MRHPIALLESLGRHVGIELGGAEAGVAEHLLHGAQVRSPIKEVGRRGMAKGMRSGRAGSRQGREQPGDEVVDRTCSQASSAGAQEQGGGRTSDKTLAHRKVLLESALGRYSERHYPLLCALSGDTGSEPSGVDVTKVESYHFADTECGSVEHFHNGQVARGSRISRASQRGKVSEDLLNLGPSEHTGQMAIRLGRPEAGRGVGGGVTGAG